MRLLSAAVFAASCLVRVVLGGMVGTAASNIALRGAVLEPTGRLAVAAGVGLTVAIGLLMGMYLTAMRPRRNDALHRLRIVLRRR